MNKKSKIFQTFLLSAFEGQCDAKIFFRVARGMRTHSPKVRRTPIRLHKMDCYFRGIELTRLKNIITYHCPCLNIFISKLPLINLWACIIITMLFASIFLNNLVYFEMNTFEMCFSFTFKPEIKQKGKLLLLLLLYN